MNPQEEPISGFKKAEEAPARILYLAGRSLDIQSNVPDPSNTLEGPMEYRSMAELVADSEPLLMPTTGINIFGVIGQRRRHSHTTKRQNDPVTLILLSGAEHSPHDGQLPQTVDRPNSPDSLSTPPRGAQSASRPNQPPFIVNRQYAPNPQAHLNNTPYPNPAGKRINVFNMQTMSDFSSSVLQSHTNYPYSLISNQLAQILCVQRYGEQFKQQFSYDNVGQPFLPSPPTSIISPHTFHESLHVQVDEQSFTAPGTPNYLKLLQELQRIVPTPKNFRPTHMVLKEADIALLSSENQNSNANNYQGSGNSRRHVLNLPDDENCTLFLTNIARQTHISEIFNEIDTGAVFCLHINPANEKFATCAAKLSFMKPEGAAKFMAKINNQFGIWFHGKQLHGVYNREGDRFNSSAVSRVIVIEGPEEIMARCYWEAYFGQICVYQLDRVLSAPCNKPGRKSMRFHFTRVDGQAQSCLQAIQVQDEYQGRVQVCYGADPCGKGVNF